MLTYKNLLDVRKAGYEAALSDLSLRVAAERVAATGAATCGIVRVARVPGNWEPVQQVLRSARFGYLRLRVRFEHMDTAGQIEEVLVLVPGLDATWASRIERHGATVVIADAVDREGLIEAISRLHPGWRVDGFDLPPSCFVEALAEGVSRGEQ